MNTYVITVNNVLNFNYNVFESFNLKRIIVVEYSPKDNSTSLIFSDYEKMLERVIFCVETKQTDTDWKPFPGQRIPKENLTPIPKTNMTLKSSAIRWLTGETNVLEIF